MADFSRQHPMLCPKDPIIQCSNSMCKKKKIIIKKTTEVADHTGPPAKTRLMVTAMAPPSLIGLGTKKIPGRREVSDKRPSSAVQYIHFYSNEILKFVSIPGQLRSPK